MKTFLKVLLLAAVLILAIKFSPVLFVGALVGLVVAAVLGAVGFGLILALLAVAISLALALSPIWVPVLVVIGLVSLFRRTNGAGGGVPPMAAPAA